MGKIKIKPENKGKFSAWAKSHGMSVQQAAAMVLRNRERYSPTLVKRANFARNAAKWEDGGMVEYGLGGFISSLGGVASAIPTPWTKVGGAALSLIGGLVGGNEEKKEQDKALELQRREDSIAMARAGQAGAVNPYAPTFKLGGSFKGKKFGGKANAEVEGGEVIITPDGSQTNMRGASHAQGGIDVQLPNNTMILSNKVKIGKGQTAADAARPYSSKINKAQEVISGNATKLAKNSSQRNLNKYYAKVFDAYNKQEAKKFGKGGLTKFDGGGVYPYQPVGNKDPLSRYVWPFDQRGKSADNPYPLGQANISANSLYNSPLSAPKSGAPFGAGQTIMGVGSDPNLRYNAPDDLMTMPELGSLNNAFPTSSNMKFSNPLDDPNSPLFNQAASKQETFEGSSFNKGEGFDWGNALSGLGEMAPMLYNLGQGLFGKRENVDANRYLNPYEGKINSLMANRKYNIDPELAANETAFRTTSANMRNLGGSRGQVMSNLTGAQNVKQFGDMSAYSQKKNMENQYAGEYAQMLYPMGRDRSMTQMAVDETNAMNKAAGRNMIGAGMSGLQQYLLTRRQMKNQATRDKMLGSAINAYGSGFATKWLGPEYEEYVKGLTSKR